MYDEDSPKMTASEVSLRARARQAARNETMDREYDSPSRTEDDRPMSLATEAMRDIETEIMEISEMTSNLYAKLKPILLEDGKVRADDPEKPLTSTDLSRALNEKARVLKQIRYRLTDLFNGIDL